MGYDVFSLFSGYRRQVWKIIRENKGLHISGNEGGKKHNKSEIMGCIFFFIKNVIIHFLNYSIVM